MKIQYNSYDYQKNRGLQRKVFLINLRGGKCEKCPYDKNIASLEFHHLNPNEKDDSLDMRHLSNRTMKWILEEFEKCIVLCANCHREEHHPDLESNIVSKRLSEFKFKSFEQKTNNKPKCLDCKIEINYTYKRCKNCNDIQKRKVKNRPSTTEIKELRTKFSLDEIAIQYNVSRRTISRWLNK
jgi:DNA-binding transcriptional regulator YiaG